MSAKYLEYVVKFVTTLKGVLNAFADLVITWNQTAAVAKPLVSTQLLSFYQGAKLNFMCEETFFAGKIMLRNF